jgi:hypothetical protein
VIEMTKEQTAMDHDKYRILGDRDYKVMADRRKKAQDDE